ncbi:MAG: hypothetical protein CYPHOPRED_002290 [Cyphobasidiales sp. Tagirdzhanova-0007]|nr:MAG: hypothetical protein CYPHOPRED_002290 [Cyphobasidiales sp. Tagirdzhanova-0007]
MSAYGHIAPLGDALQRPLTPLVYRLPDELKDLAVICLESSQIPEELGLHLREVFNGIVREGRTYPQERELSLQEFKNYYLSYNLFVGLLIPKEGARTFEETHELPQSFFADFQAEMGNKLWSDVIAGSYYIKPNYPGRSSHCCNAGFIVEPKHRNLKIGRTLAKSYLHFAPRLGYKFSIFNLVYVNNVASVRIWDSLGFTRAGLVPKAGRLKTVDGESEEYVDAILYWKDLSTPTA